MTAADAFDPRSHARETRLRYGVAPMEVRHVPAVAAIERLSFSTVWPESAYRREIERNDMAHYLIAYRQGGTPDRRPQPRFTPQQAVETAEDRSLIGRISKALRGTPRLLSPLEAEELDRIVGYCGMWLMFDEAHITTIAVDPAYRGEGVGELMLLRLLDEALYLGAAEVTLECRVSNTVAQALYRKYTFRDVGLRKRYYSDDGEDALIMTTERLDTEHFLAVLEQNRARLTERLRAD